MVNAVHHLNSNKKYYANYTRIESRVATPEAMPELWADWCHQYGREAPDERRLSSQVRQHMTNQKIHDDDTVDDEKQDVQAPGHGWHIILIVDCIILVFSQHAHRCLQHRSAWGWEWHLQIKLHSGREIINKQFLRIRIGFWQWGHNYGWWYRKGGL